MNRDISYIHSNKLAVPNKLYYGKDGVYIGLSNGRLKKLEKSFDPTQLEKSISELEKEVNNTPSIISGTEGVSINVIMAHIASY